MSNTLPCGECILYAEQKKPQPKDKPAKSLRYGHCLDRTIYAVNKPGTHVFPPGAKTAELPHGKHKIAMVREKHVVPNCLAATARTVE